MANTYDLWMEAARSHVGVWFDSTPELWAVCLQWRVWPERIEEVSFEGAAPSGKGILWSRSAFLLTAHQRLQQERTAPTFETGLVLLANNAAGPKLRHNAGTVSVLFAREKVRHKQHPFFVAQTIDPKHAVVERFDERDHRALFDAP